MTGLALGLKPFSRKDLDAALKRSSSTVVHAAPMLMRHGCSGGAVVMRLAALGWTAEAAVPTSS